MNVPEEFNKLCGQIHQDTFLIHDTWEEALANAAGVLSREESE